MSSDTMTPPPPVEESRPGLVARVAMALIRTYQHARAGRLSPCRFQPTCSTYALDAVQTHGTLRGGVLAVRRIGRCHPWGGSGWDPVPERRS
jgi:putative membrane protein insertion efficiency factor